MPGRLEIPLVVEPTEGLVGIDRSQFGECRVGFSRLFPMKGLDLLVLLVKLVERPDEADEGLSGVGGGRGARGLAVGLAVDLAGLLSEGFVIVHPIAERVVGIRGNPIVLLSRPWCGSLIRVYFLTRSLFPRRSPHVASSARYLACDRLLVLHGPPIRARGPLALGRQSWSFRFSTASMLTITIVFN
jgi:hypothetical protein